MDWYWCKRPTLVIVACAAHVCHETRKGGVVIKAALLDVSMTLTLRGVLDVERQRRTAMPCHGTADGCNVARMLSG
ncbi:MAG: hypothetical protein WCF90_07495 [Methanomicrobiales archaeon]